MRKDGSLLVCRTSHADMDCGKVFKLSKMGVTNRFHTDGLSEVRSFDFSGYNI